MLAADHHAGLELLGVPPAHESFQPRSLSWWEEHGLQAEAWVPLALALLGLYLWVRLATAPPSVN